MRSHVAACVAAFAGWLVCAQFASIGYYWTLYYVLALSVAAHESSSGACWAAAASPAGATA